MKDYISAIRFVKAVALGKSATPIDHFLVGHTAIDGRPAIAQFDQDDRYIRISYKNVDYFDLVPVANIASIAVTPVKTEK